MVLLGEMDCFSARSRSRTSFLNGQADERLVCLLLRKLAGLQLQELNVCV